MMVSEMGLCVGLDRCGLKWRLERKMSVSRLGEVEYRVTFEREGLRGGRFVYFFGELGFWD